LFGTYVKLGQSHQGTSTDYISGQAAAEKLAFTCKRESKETGDIFTAIIAQSCFGQIFIQKEIFIPDLRYFWGSLFVDLFFS
jgi:hypothetical protein